MNEMTLFQPTDIFSQLEPAGKNLPAEYRKYQKAMNRLTTIGAEYLQARSFAQSYGNFHIVMQMQEVHHLKQFYAYMMTPLLEDYLESASKKYMLDILDLLNKSNHHMVQIFLKAAAQPDEESFLKELGRLLESHFSW